jgi:hypothetical protein
LDPELFDLLMSEWLREGQINRFLEYLLDVYLIQCVWSQGPQIDYERVVKVIQDCDMTYEDLDELNFFFFI